MFSAYTPHHGWEARFPHSGNLQRETRRETEIQRDSQRETDRKGKRDRETEIEGDRQRGREREQPAAAGRPLTEQGATWQPAHPTAAAGRSLLASVLTKEQGLSATARQALPAGQPIGPGATPATSLLAGPRAQGLASSFPGSAQLLTPGGRALGLPGSRKHCAGPEEAGKGRAVVAASTDRTLEPGVHAPGPGLEVGGRGPEGGRAQMTCEPRALSQQLQGAPAGILRAHLGCAAPNQDGNPRPT